MELGVGIILNANAHVLYRRPEYFRNPATCAGIGRDIRVQGRIRAPRGAEIAQARAIFRPIDIAGLQSQLVKGIGGIAGNAGHVAIGDGFPDIANLRRYGMRIQQILILRIYASIAITCRRADRVGIVRIDLGIHGKYPNHRTMRPPVVAQRQSYVGVGALKICLVLRFCALA